MDNGQRANIANIGLACKQTSKAITEKWELTPANHRKSNINLNYRDTPSQISYNQVHKPIIKNCSEQINIHDPILPLADLLFAVPITSYACSGAINPKRKKDDDDDDNKKKIIMDKRNIRKETLFNEEEFSLIQQKSLIADIQPAVFIRETALSKDIKAALSQQEIDMIRRNQKVSVALQTNLNQ